MSRFGVFTIDGTPYDLDDLELDDVEEIEQNSVREVVRRENETDESFSLRQDKAEREATFGQMDFSSGRVMKAIAFTLMRRDNPALKMEDVGKLKLLSFAPPDEEMPASPPAIPTASPSDSEPGDSGPQLSAVATSMSG